MLQAKIDFGSRPALGSHDFEVEDFHTYFVSEAGVWVHNHGFSCDRYFSRWKELTKGGFDDLSGNFLDLTKMANVILR